MQHNLKPQCCEPAKERQCQDEGLNTAAYLLYEVPEEDGLLSKGIMNQAFGKEDHPVGKIVLRQPGDHALLLHVRAAGDVDDQITQVLPMPARK